MKLLKGLLGVLFLASIMSLNTGCGPGEAEDIDAAGQKVEHPPGHEQAVKEMHKKPAK